MEFDEINQRLLELWARQTDPPEYGPVMHGALEKGGVVFVGLNPSFFERGWCR